MTKKTNKLISDCIDKSADTALYLLSRFDDDYFRDPAASLAKICDAVATLSSLCGVEGEGSKYGVIALPIKRDDTNQ